MTGDKGNGDGELRKDFPGGWQGDKVNCFVPEGRTTLQNEAFEFTRKLLNWRKGNEVLAHGTLKHYSISQGTYVYQRAYNGKSVVVVMNGTDAPQELNLESYREVLPQSECTDFLSGKKVDLTEKLSLKEREILIFCL